MSDTDKPKYLANATIQIDLAQVQLVDPDAPPLGADDRKAPPPLPPGAAAMAVPGTGGASGTAAIPAAAPAEPRNVGKTVALVAMFVVLIGAAVAGGLFVGTRVRGTPAAPSAAALPAAPPVTSAAAAPTPSASAETLTIPTIEMR